MQTYQTIKLDFMFSNVKEIYSIENPMCIIMLIELRQQIEELGVVIITHCDPILSDMRPLYFSTIQLATRSALTINNNSQTKGSHSKGSPAEYNNVIMGIALSQFSDDRTPGGISVQ